jgi:septal ring factor EnvC (AmiA/AmiB activator)
MDTFLLLQILFDAILLFGILFVFHYSLHQSEKKKEETALLESVQTMEIKENLQELLTTLKQLGAEVSDNIQEQVKEAEEKTALFKNTVQKLKRDLEKADKLAAEIEMEKTHLEEKIEVMKTNKGKSSVMAFIKEPLTSKEPADKGPHGNAKIKGKSKKQDGVDINSSKTVDEVYHLADQSFDINEIVQKTRLSRAEVQLILNLRESRYTTPN